jgi:hypothetical protein
MGHEIVYCADCGKRLAEQEFLKGQAHVLDDRPYCVECRPAPPPTRPPSEKKLTPPSMRRVGSSARHPIIKPPPSPASKTRAIAIGGAAGGALLIVVLVAVLSSGGKPSGRVEPRELPAAPPATSSTKPASDRAGEALRKLESAATASDPDAILQAVDEARRVLKGLPQERRVDEIEQRALAARRERNREREVEKALVEAKRMEAGDPEFLRSVEIESMLGVALKQGGQRTAEVQKRLDDYRARARAAAEKRGKGPFDLDGQGYILNWLLLGPFPNEGDKGLDVDFLKVEATHEPKEGLQLGTARWGAHASSAPRVRFHEASHLGVREKQPNIVAYAACKILIDSDQEVVVRVGSDDGMAIWLDGRELGRVHLHRSAAPDQDAYPVRLAKGQHRLLLKVENAGTDFEFLVRITLPNGALPAGIRIYN